MLLPDAVLSQLLPLALSLEFHNPDDHGFPISNHWLGIMLIGFGLLCMSGSVTTSKTVDLTRWLRLQYDERPVTGLERFVVVVACIAGGIYLLTHP